MTKYKAMCEQAVWSFIPAAFSIWGSVGPCSRALMSETLRRVTSELDGWPKIKKLMEVRGSIRITLARQVANQLSARYQVMDQ